MIVPAYANSTLDNEYMTGEQSYHYYNEFLWPKPVSYTHLDVYKRQELQRSIDGISQKVLTDSLRQMMSDGLAYHHDYHEQPPRVEYGLSELGTKMLPIVNSLADFGNYYKSIIEQN